MTSRLPSLEITQLQPGEEQSWQDFLAISANGTLFHDLRFLAYHPRDRFRFHHLVARRAGKLVALLPGGLVGTEGKFVFTSLIGASVGGPVVAPRAPGEQALELIAELQSYARNRGWAGLNITLPPPIYNPAAGASIEFALFCRGFVLEHRWLCHIVPLNQPGPERYKRLFRDTQANLVRVARRKGTKLVQGGIEHVDYFLEVFEDTYTRHGVAATHTPDEIRDLLRRLPDRVRVYLAILDERPTAGILAFLVNSKVAYTFYICASTERANDNGNLAVIAAMAERLADEGYAWLDLGPSASDLNYNKGVAFFKEGLGAVGYCRDRWHWSVPR